jgi:hypothetical protein
MIEYFLLILAVPLGYILAKLTQDESPIYTKKIYFPTLQKILLILLAITISQDQQLFLTSTFLLITLYIWNKH